MFFYYGHYNHILLIRMHGIDALDLQEKLFFPPFPLSLMFFCGMSQTWLLIIISILFVIGTTIMFSPLGYTMLMLWICKKSFLSTIFLVIKVHPWNEVNLHTHNNLHSFCYWLCNNVLHSKRHDTNALDLQEELFFPPFSFNQSSFEKGDKLGYS